MLASIIRNSQKNKTFPVTIGSHARFMSVIPIGFRRRKKKSVRRIIPSERGMPFEMKRLDVVLPDLIFDHTSEKGWLGKLFQGDSLKLAEQKKKETSSLKELRNLKDVNEKYKSLGPEVQKEMEDTFIKAFEAYVKQDYNALNNLSTYAYYHNLKKEREALAQYGKLTWILKRIIPNSELITNWSMDAYCALDKCPRKEFYALMRITLEHSIELEENDGNVVVGCINKFFTHPHFLVFQYMPLSKYDTWKLYCRVIREEKELYPENKPPTNSG